MCSLLVFVSSCWIRIPLRPIDATRILEQAPANYRQLIGATRSLHFAGQALLRKGKYVFQAEPELWVRVAENTVATITVDAAFEPDESGQPSLAIHSARVSFDQPVIGNRGFKHGPGGIRGPIREIQLSSEDRSSVSAELAGALARTVVSLVVPMTSEPVQPTSEMLASLVVTSLDYEMREGATIELGGSTLALADTERSKLAIRDASWDPKSGRVDGRGQLDLRLGKGTVLRRGVEQVAVGSATFSASLLVEIGANGTMTLQLDPESTQPARFGLEDGRVSVSNSSSNLALSVARFEAAVREFKLDDSALMLDVAGSIELGRSVVASSMGPLLVSGARLDEFQLEYATLRPELQAELGMKEPSSLRIHAPRLTAPDVLLIATTGNQGLSTADLEGAPLQDIRDLAALLANSHSGAPQPFGHLRPVGPTICSIYPSADVVPAERCESVCGGPKRAASGSLGMSLVGPVEDLALMLFQHQVAVGGVIACEHFEDGEPAGYATPSASKCRAMCKADLSPFEVVAERTEELIKPRLVRGEFERELRVGEVISSMSITEPAAWAYFRDFRVDDLRAESLGHLIAASGQIDWQRLQLGWDDGNGRRVFVKSDDPSGVFVGLGTRFSVGVDPQADFDPSLVARGRWPSLMIKDGDHSIAMRDVVADFHAESLEPLRGRVEVGVAEAALKGTALDGAAFRLSSLRMVLGEEVEVDVEGLVVQVPAAYAVERIQAQLPSEKSQDPKNISNDLEKAALNYLFPIVSGNITDVGRYKEWHTIVDATGLDGLQIRSSKDGLQVVGKIMVVIRLMANKQHIRCRVFPPDCDSWHSVEEVARASLRVNIEGRVALETNAPAKLSELEIIARPTFDYTNVEGLQNDVEKLILEKAWQKLEAKGIEVALGSIIDSSRGGLDPERLLVEKAEITFDESLVTVALDAHYE